MVKHFRLIAVAQLLTYSLRSDFSCSEREPIVAHFLAKRLTISCCFGQGGRWLTSQTALHYLISSPYWPFQEKAKLNCVSLWRHVKLYPRTDLSAIRRPPRVGLIYQRGVWDWISVASRCTTHMSLYLFWKSFLFRLTALQPGVSCWFNFVTLK